MPEVKVIGLDELLSRMSAYPEKLAAGMGEAMQDTLLVMNESIPSYPPQPAMSNYDRTGTLGRTLGSSEGGGKSGDADIYEVRAMGSVWEGHFGTNLEYAPHVVGEEQAAHMSHWWILSQVADKALSKIVKVWQALAEAMKKFVEAK